MADLPLNGDWGVRMKHHFHGWNVVAEQLESLAAAGGTEHWSLNEGQCASLRGIGARLPRNGVVIADEVGMGKTRIAVALARSVIRAGGRVVILVPPGLGFQWQDELRDGGVEAPALLRSIWKFLEVWMPEPSVEKPWFERDVVLVSHAFTNWRLGEGSGAWRWALLPAVYAWWRKLTDGRFPRGFHTQERLDDRWAQVAVRAARSITEAVHCLPEEHPSRRLIDDLCAKTPWPGAMDPTEYGSNQLLRPWLESAVGLGLGAFDLVIIDEAHKSRGDESGLSRMLDRVVVPNDAARRLAMTATPVELDASQWHQTLERIGVNGVGHSDVEGDIFRRYAAACAQVRQCPNNPEARDGYRAFARLFQHALSPYLLRRDKRELHCVQTFSERSGDPPHAYRQELEISVDTATLDPAWRQAVCAAEALSLVTHLVDDPVSKRLRLTIGNGHGIAALLDTVKQDAERDRQQLDLEAKMGEKAPDSSRARGPDKRKQRTEWWKNVIGTAFSAADNPLFDHPAILAAVDAIEDVTRSGEKVLVFGRFTLPLLTLMGVLNARAMLRALDTGELWAQSKVHDDEWPAIQAAHRQLHRQGEADRAVLDRQLERQYRKLELRRRDSRTDLLELLEIGLKDGRARQVFQAFRRSVAEHVGVGESPLALVAKALHALTGLGSEDRSATRLAAAFAELIEAVCERGEGDEVADGKLNEDEAMSLWGLLQARLANEYNRTEGGFARLMYGGTPPDTRRLLQLAFNRPHSNPRVLVAQSVVGREGLNLHRACKTVVLLHPEWNPGVVEQQVGRVDRVGSLWEKALEEALNTQVVGEHLPRIVVRPVVFRGTYDERNWDVLRERWDDLRAQLHGVVISPRLGEAAGLSNSLIEEINACAPSFSPRESELCSICRVNTATTYREEHDTWLGMSNQRPSCSQCASQAPEWMT